MNPGMLPIKPSKARWARWGCLTLLAIIVIFPLSWCHFTPGNRFPEEVLKALRDDPAATFYSIEPWPDREHQASGFQGHEIAGKIVLQSSADREFLARALHRSTLGAWDRMACFDPRHAFRVTGEAGAYELLLCFDCGQASVLMPDGSRRNVLIRDGVDTFNEFLKSHGIPLPKQ